MTVIVTDAYSEQSYVPQSSSTQFSANSYGNSVYGQSNTTTYGGFYVDKPRVRFEVTLFDSKTNEIAWKATTFTKGNAFTENDTIIKSIASEVVDKLAGNQTSY